MKRILPLVIFALSALNLKAQVGINNLSPSASLDIAASNQATPANTDGLLIPRIDAFPASDPAAAQHGMLVYLTTTDGGNPPGFYFWNNGTTTWDSISGSGAQQINELTDGITDGSSLFLGASSGINDDGANSNVGVGLFSLSNNTSGNSNTAVGSLAMINNTTGIGNTAVGRQSLPTNTTGNDNTMIGFQAGLSSSTGSQNVGVGSFSLDANTTGSDNTAIGYASLSQNNTGRQNTAIGTTALAGNIDGIDNVGIGNGALTANISGDYNVALGNNALSGLVNAEYNIAIGRSALSASSTSTDANQNVAIGSRALANLSSGEQNVGIGDYVMEAVTSGSFNVATGASALRDITSGARNMAYGYLAGRNITSGNNNTFMGSIAGSANETGNFNTMLGSSAGYSNLGSNNVFVGNLAGGLNVSGSNNVFIGNSAGSNETGSNLLFIDNTATADPLIWGNFLSNDLRINGQLQVGNPSGTGYEFPSTDGSTGQVLRTNGSGGLGWVDFTDDADWYEEGTTGAPSASSDDIFTDGNVGIGTSTVTYPLDIDATATRTVDLENTGNGFIYGVFNRINEASPSASTTSTYGIVNSITRTNQSLVSGLSNSFSNTDATASSGFLYGVDNSFGNSTSTISVGFLNRFQGTTTTGAGIRNLIAGSFTDFYGVQNYNITGSHNGTFYGLHNLFDSSGGNGLRYGAYTEFNDTGSGDKYGYYATIASTAGGTHYGIYSSALKSGSYAGYFLGDVSIGTSGTDNYTFPASRGTNGQVMVTDGAGNLSWSTLSLTDATTASNGLSESSDDIQLGGSLSQETTITYGANNFIHNLDGSGYLEVQDEGTAKFRVSNTGNTRVGGDLQINQSDVTGTRLVELTGTGSTGLINVYAAGALRTQIAGTGDTYFNGGSVGIGMTNPDEQLDVVDNTVSYVADFFNTSTSTFADGIRVRLNATSPNASAYYVGFFRAAGGTVSGRISGSTTGTGVQLVTTSDRRLKTNFEPIGNALDLISDIEPQWYEFKSNLGFKELGFIAQEVKEVFPQIVTGDESSDPNEDPMMVDYARITPLLTAGIKELNEKVQALEAENAQLKQQLDQYAALEARIAALEGGDKSNKSQAPVVSEE